jgi:hypothetical protein
MDESDWQKFIANGRPREVPVGRMAPLLLKVLRADTNRVVLRHDYALKTVHKHQLDFYQFPMMGITLDLGMAVHDDTRPNHLLFLHRDDVIFERWYKLVVKLTKPGELYVTTFHRVEAVDVNRLVKGRQILRDGID